LNFSLVYEFGITHNVQAGWEVAMLSKTEVTKDFRKQILGYGLTTAEIVYRRPDRHWLLQAYVWQDYDMFPQRAVERVRSRSYPALQAGSFSIACATTDTAAAIAAHAAQGAWPRNCGMNCSTLSRRSLPAAAYSPTHAEVSAAPMAI
jgi:hypothetical protein